MSAGSERDSAVAPALLTGKLGGWFLEFEKGGTLLNLDWRDGPPLLHWSDYDFDLGDGRVFHPRGWDECFPTIDAHAQSGVMGHLVGRAPALRVAEASICQEWTYPGVTATRTFLSPAPHELLVRFEARNTGDQPVEHLWASHALFSVVGLLKVVLPDGNVLGDFSRDMSCLKFFVNASGPVRLERQESVVNLSTDQPFWGIWLNRGGWPAAGAAGFCCIGVEATNTDAEVPRDAVLAPGGTFTGQVNMVIETANS